MHHGIVGAVGAVMSIASILGGGRIAAGTIDEASRQAEVHVIHSRLVQMEAAVELARLRMGRNAVPLGDMISLTPRFLKELPVAETMEEDARTAASSRPRLAHDLVGGAGPAGYILMPLGRGHDADDLCRRIASSAGDPRTPVRTTRTGCLHGRDGWSAWRRLS